MKTRHGVVVISFALGTLVGAFLLIRAPTQKADQSVPFKQLSHAYCGGHKQRKMFAISNESEWGAFLKVTNGGARMNVPALHPDFAQNMLIAVCQGWHSMGMGSYRVEITNLVETKDALRVTVKETIPGDRCAVTDAETSACDLVETKKTDKKVVFEVVESRIDCR